MKKLIFICLLAIITLSCRQTLKAQITLEHTYDSASANLYMVNLEVEGEKYIKRDFNNMLINLYNLDHSVFKSIAIPNLNISLTPTPSILYVSEHLFNSDDLIEYMIAYTDNVNSIIHTKIINELGNIVFSVDSAQPIVYPNVPQAQVPIYNTINGTKMILSFQSTISNLHPRANVYGLSGHLSNSIQPIPFGNDNQMTETIYPNPSNGNTTIEFNLPQGVNQGEIIIYSMQGQQLKSYKVDNTFHTLLLNDSEFKAGTYFYQLRTVNGISGARKMVVIH